MTRSADSEEQTFYHAGQRALQDEFDSRRLADRLEETTRRTAFTAKDRDFISSRTMFFLATADPVGRPDCSYKGGRPGFVHVVDDTTLVFPNYDGNGQFRSLGNIVANPSVGLLFIDFDSPGRLRVNGAASLVRDAAQLTDFPGAQLLVQVRVTDIFPNCPRYIHPAAQQTLSVYAPAAGHTPPEPEWKRMPVFEPYLPRKP